jgi:hypothetical protein
MSAPSITTAPSAEPDWSALANNAGRPNRSIYRPATQWKTSKPNLRIASLLKDWEPAKPIAPIPVAPLKPHKRRLILGVAGFVVMVAGFFALTWVHDSRDWRDEQQAGRRSAIFQQGKALLGQIAVQARQADRLEEKALLLLQYAADLRYSGSIDSSIRQVEQADAFLADRDHLQTEIEHTHKRLAALSQELAALPRR